MESFNNKNSLELKNKVKLARVENDLTQDELAKLTGVTRQTIGAIESGKFNPTAKLALVFCIILEKTFDELFYFDI